LERADRMVGKFHTDDLIYDSAFPIITAGVSLNPGQGILERGTLLSVNDEGKAVIFSQGSKPYGILTDRKDTGTDGDAFEAEAEAYITGRFNSNKIYAAEGYELTFEDKQNLRKLGILLQAKMPM